jgi:hypothetical protein
LCIAFQKHWDVESSVAVFVPRCYEHFVFGCCAGGLFMYGLKHLLVIMHILYGSVRQVSECTNALPDDCQKGTRTYTYSVFIYTIVVTGHSDKLYTHNMTLKYNISTLRYISS